MPKTALFRARVDARRKKNAERILAKVGLTPGQLVNMVFAQVELKNGLPFAVNAFATDDGYLPHVPNAETLKAIKEKAGKRFSSPEAFLADLKSSKDRTDHRAGEGTSAPPHRKLRA
jgi:addiction module RelB/DinJ family antitoxin